MIIDWGAFLVVFASALVAAVFVVSLYSLGIRFLATPARPPEGSPGAKGQPRDDEDDDIDDLDRPRWASIAAYTCFGFSVVAVLVGIYLIVPALHR